MKPKINFWSLLGKWFCISVVLMLLNGFFFKISILDNIIKASLGIILLFYPVYPANLENKYTEKQCRIFIRIVAVIEILLSFAVKTRF